MLGKRYLRGRPYCRETGNFIQTEGLALPVFLRAIIGPSRKIDIWSLLKWRKIIPVTINS
jgi:hypothetical protein